MVTSGALLPLLLLLPALSAGQGRDLDPSQNLALGKPVVFLPAPNYRLTVRGDTDTTDLTDGKLTQRPDLHMWFEQSAVGWSYAGRVNLAIDLGGVHPVDEVAIRFLGGSPQAGICMPGWVEVMVADDLRGPYYKVGEYSRWQPGDRRKFHIPRYTGKAWVHRLRFTGLRTRARAVGIRFYGSGLTCSDELYVFKGNHDPASVPHPPGPITDFTVTDAELYFHKPVVYVTRNIATPLPIGLITVPSETPKPLSVRIAVPEGVRIVGGSLGGQEVGDAQITPGPNHTTLYSWQLQTKGQRTKTFGRLFLTGAPSSGSSPALTYSLGWGDYKSPEIAIPIHTIHVPPQPRMPQFLMTSLSWWPTSATMAWPRWHEAFRHLGFNTVTSFSTWFNPQTDTDVVRFLDDARRRGYKVQTIDATWHRMLSRRRNEPEIYCQFDDGTHGSRLCPSYRGKFYREELQRVAAAVRLLKPNYFHTDVELWSWRGPVDARKCTRCRADKARSGIDSWEEWQLAKGEEMWKDLYNTVRGALEKAGVKQWEMGSYDFRPGAAYQFTWPFDRLYPAYMHSSQVSTYTPLEPYHIELVGDEVRADRRKLPRSDVLPWITPGDAGTFSGEEFYYALLECFCNGARGINFWSGRVWDADLLAAYARAIRAIAPVEDIVVNGQLFLPELVGKGRVSGVKHGSRIVLLVADYHGDTSGSVRVRLNLPKSMRVSDLDGGQELGEIPAGPTIYEVKLGGQKARILYLRP